MDSINRFKLGMNEVMENCQLTANKQDVLDATPGSGGS